jgi:glycosyltransferase involved in cell wall biosynthesis
VLLGNRTWGPNAQAAATMVSWWPRIADGIPGAELWLVGPRGGDGTAPLPYNVTDLGRVDDVDATLVQCRALVAPVSVGGGVRVKVLEAAARGLPVVCTGAAVGSIESSLGIAAARAVDTFVARCRSLLSDAARAAEEGARLHAANAQRWTDRVGHDAVHTWLSA